MVSSAVCDMTHLHRRAERFPALKKAAPQPHGRLRFATRRSEVRCSRSVRAFDYTARRATGTRRLTRPTASQPCLSRLVQFRFRSNTRTCVSRRAQLEHTRVLRALPEPDRLARRLQDPATDAAAQEAGGTYELAREHAWHVIGAS